MCHRPKPARPIRPSLTTSPTGGAHGASADLLPRDCPGPATESGARGGGRTKILRLVPPGTAVAAAC
jgi:hypothetical protein